MSSETKERPILFNAEMVRAVLAGRKTQTRRVVKPQPTGKCLTDFNPTTCVFEHWDRGYEADAAEFPCPYGVPGDRLWVREAFNKAPANPYRYRADYPPDCIFRWKPSIHMPRVASRILLEVTDVRVERVAEISEDDAVAEGCTPATCPDPRSPSGYSLNLNARVGGPRREFKTLWESIAKPGQQWSDNPWVWAVTFKVLEGGADHA